MRQTRSLSGSEFEKELCEKFGYISQAKKPKIIWSGHGSNLMKIKSLNFDATKFKPLESSTFEKWDILTQDGGKREVKKYFISEVSNWTLYSEPIVKVCTRGNLEFIRKHYGKGDLKSAIDIYNKFINEVFTIFESDGTFDKLLSNLTSTSEGIEFKDGFVPKSNIEFRWKMRKSYWQGFDRIMLEFRVVN